MNKFTILTLAATALVPVGAAAQTSHSTSHSGSHSASSSVSHSTARSHSGVSWQHRGRGPGMHHRGRGPIVRHHPGPGGHQRFVIHRRDGKMMGGHHAINRHRNYKRIERGFIVPHLWWGPRFHVQNWGMYGFARPMHGRRWVRYYDDALLIDHAGRVHDGRWGMNWDEYEDRWAYDEQGVPYYDGESDYYPGEEDDAWVEGEEGAHAEHHRPPPPPCARVCPPPMPHPHGYGAYGYGYGWMPGGMVTITETTVHAAAPQVVTETVYIEKKVKTKPRRTYKRAKPRPQPGERG